MKLRRLLLVLLLLGGVHLATAAPASACDCAPGSDQSQLEYADAVFVGDLVGHVAPPRLFGWSSVDAAIWTFEVDDVYKGDVAARQDVASPADGASCGLELAHEGRFLVFASTEPSVVETVPGEPLYALLCSGTRELSEGAVPATFGKPKSPTPGVRAAGVSQSAEPSSMTPSSSAPSASPTAAASGPGPGSAPDWATVAAVSTAGLALAVAVSIVPLRRTRRR